MEKILLEVTPRDMKFSPGYLRSQQKIPAVYYGRKEKSIALEVDYQAFRKAFDEAGSNQIIELSIQGKKKPVLVHEVQYNPITDRISHIDFLHISMDVEVKAHIPVEILGIAPAVKDLGGILTTLKHEIEVRCLPADLPHTIQVDVSGLELLHSSIHIGDLTMPKGVKIHGSVDDVVVTVTPPKVEEEAPTAAAAQAVPEAGAEGVTAAPVEGGAAITGTTASKE